MSAKYPRTPHLPYSPGGTNDDERLETAAHLVGRPIVILEKMDGGNWCEEREACFSRPHSGNTKNPIFDPAKGMWAARRWLINPEVSVFGEWLFYTHSIEYSALPGFYLPFTVRRHQIGEWTAWSDVVLVCQALALPTVPVLWTGTVSSERELRTLIESFVRQPSACGGEREGVVVRVADRIQDYQWKASIAKWVRRHHIQRDPDLTRRNRLART